MIIQIDRSKMNTFNLLGEEPYILHETMNGKIDQVSYEDLTQDDEEGEAYY